MGTAKSKKIKQLERYIYRLKYELPTPQQPRMHTIRNAKLSPATIKNGVFTYSGKSLIFTAHHNRCDICGYNNVDALEIHHINSIHENNQLSNIAVLCANCHTLVTKKKIRYDPLCHIKELQTENIINSGEPENISKKKP